MKQTLPDAPSYSIAWFKLAEFVARGEKERALGIYRLLAHTIDDEAFVLQLEGDLFLAFQDMPQAQERYLEAARRYRKAGKLLQSAAVYEHLLGLADDTEQHLCVLTELYDELGHTDYLIQTTCQLVVVLVQKNQMSRARKLLSSLEEHAQQCPVASLHAQLACAMISTGFTTHQTIREHIQRALDGFVASDDHQELQAFLSKLETLEPVQHAWALNHLRG